MIRDEQKVTRAHLERTAIVYVRQSTLMQVREHTESTLRQYDLAAQAARLGWAAGDIEVIDADLGLSGRSASHRDGFKQLVARVCLGEAGAVFGLEVSRLARSNADLARLLELARLTDTLVIDNNGVYDLSDINDRLLLGLKSQMSEAELHWLTSRMNEAKRAAARAASCASRCPSGSSTTTRTTWSSTPTRRSPPRSATCSPRSPPPGRPTGWPGRSPAGGSRAAPTAARGPGSCAGAGSPTPAPPGSCATRPTRGRTCSGGAAPARSSTRTGQCAPRSPNCPATSGKC